MTTLVLQFSVFFRFLDTRFHYFFSRFRRFFFSQVATPSKRKFDLLPAGKCAHGDTIE